MPQYEPLQRYLQRQERDEISLSYADIENILGRKLPPSVEGPYWRQWWANTETHSQGQAWLRAGWRVSRPQKGRIEFKRLEARSGSGAGAETDGSGSRQPILLRQEDLTGSALRLLRDYAEEAGEPLERAAAGLLNRAAAERRRHLLDWFAAHTKPSVVTGAELVREDRDGR
jgi:hypothetical protein